jgi:hypothetical protein
MTVQVSICCDAIVAFIAFLSHVSITVYKTCAERTTSNFAVLVQLLLKTDDQRRRNTLPEKTICFSHLPIISRLICRDHIVDTIPNRRSDCYDSTKNLLVYVSEEG